jgi:hypothetical protein
MIKAGNSKDPLFSIFPNPAADYIIINALENAQIARLQIFDANGRSVYQLQNGRNRVDISKLTPGIYCIKAENNSGDVYKTSFIKQ